MMEHGAKSLGAVIESTAQIGTGNYLESIL